MGGIPIQPAGWVMARGLRLESQKRLRRERHLAEITPVRPSPERLEVEDVFDS